MDAARQVLSKITLSPALIGLCAAHLFCYLLSLLLHASSLHTLELTPSLFFTGSLWQPLTAGFTDTSLIALLLILSLLALSNRFLEPVWGTAEYVKFVLLVNCSSYAVNLLIYLIGYIAVREEKFLYAPFSGSHALSAGLLVGLKQLIPDHVMVRAVPGLRVRHLPLCLLGWCVFVTVIRATNTRYFTVTIAGFAASWVYLRYFQIRDSGRGDLSDALSLASFFPESAQPHVLKYSTAVSGAVDGMMKKRRPSSVSSTRTAVETLSGGALASDPVTERRKQLALQALNERLQKSEDVDWPSSESESESESKKTAAEEIV